MILHAKDLCFGYDGRQVLDSLGFDIAAGEILAVLGPNGVGKTTLLKCLNSMHRPRGGAVLVEGLDVFRMARAEVAKRLGYVAQRAEAGRMTAFDAVLLGRKPHMGWRASARDLRLGEAALRHVGLSHLALRSIDRMSGGELQKVCIARALVQEPQIMLLDEPTSSLDLRNQLEVLRTIRHVVEGHGMAAIMTMHDLNTALRFAHRLLLIKDGRVHALCTPDELGPEVIESVYGVAVDIVRHGRQPFIIPKDI
ncbi:ABC transporter ATP-binding protein [Desulfocurvibacter africanus]|uniref:Phosphonate-transporting ATPase n=1 Tax=Desulfocurvibacter africanus subsp. africanus str. Walvis Bay TaxID=690850 RepID=F3Z1L1_DESAF|nr:ABC transporter ATP-binding protein [Desulfocurvibacter africanus]EGJ50042.1 Phosphonate-transporting ATPase [Desulfocurvibacter africanus subsp. africanus str. Walvis Bay]